MIDRQLKRELEKINVPAYDVQKLEETISKAKRIELYPERERMTNTEFFFNQLNFIKKRTWLLKSCFSILVLYLLNVKNMNFNSWIWTLIAISGPVLCLINANEICNIFQPGMLEIQMTAKNSFSKVLMIRLMVFGILDLFFFLCAAVVMSIFKETVIWQVIVYGTVPYEIMCFGCMFILNRCREENMLLYSSTWGICLSCIIVTLKISGIEIFTTYYWSLWVAIGCLTISGAGLELRKLLKKAGGNLNEINYGTFI